MKAGNEIKAGWAIVTCPNCATAWGQKPGSDSRPVEMSDGLCPNCRTRSNDLLAQELETIGNTLEEHNDRLVLYTAAARLQQMVMRAWHPPWYGDSVTPHDIEGPLFLVAYHGRIGLARRSGGCWVVRASLGDVGQGILSTQVDAWTPLPEYPLPRDLMPPRDVGSKVGAAIADHIRAGGLDQMMRQRKAAQR